MRIDVRTGSRLHFGLICSGDGRPWNYGGVGLMIRQPGWTLHARPAHGPADIVHAGDEVARRIAAVRSALTDETNPRGIEFTISQEPPRHAGLGSGTQLALAVAAATQRLHGRPATDLNSAQQVGRARRSAIGSAGFLFGGFLADRGLDRDGQRLPVDRRAVPEQWRFVVVRPTRGHGLNGADETAYFQQRRQMPEELVARLVLVVEDQLIPAITAMDCAAFASALECYGRLAGEFYAAEQGGVFAHPTIRALAGHLRRLGIPGLAQSSWGPAACIPVASPAAAQELMAQIPGELGGDTLLSLVAEPMNCGALITSPAPADSTAPRA
jgi:beta-RFAP synthase